jgi:hypothetical protein
MPRAVADPHLLSPEERELIVAAAAGRGRLRICTRSDTHGRAVCTTDRTFADPADRSVAQRYIEGVRRLEQCLLLRQCGQRYSYELTNVGWQSSRALTRAAEPMLVDEHAPPEDVDVTSDEATSHVNLIEAP